MVQVYRRMVSLSWPLAATHPNEISKILWTLISLLHWLVHWSNKNVTCCIVKRVNLSNRMLLIYKQVTIVHNSRYTLLPRSRSIYNVLVCQLVLHTLVAQWVVCLTRNRWMLVSCVFEPHQGCRCFLEQETLPPLLSTGWFQERIRAWFT